MARTSTITVPDELRNLQAKAIEQRDRFVLGVAQGHKREPSKAQKRLLKRPAVVNSPQEGRGSLFRFLSPYWRGLNGTQKAIWSSAALFSNLTNWQLFISDNAARIRNSVTFPATPSDIWQVRTGRILIESPATEIILKQEHPQSYQVAEKIPSTPWKQQIVTLTEVFSLPLEIAISYKANLTPVGDEQIARYRAAVWTSYQGQDILTPLDINFDPSTDWTQDSISTSGLRGILIGYTLYLEISGYTGELLFDNIVAMHSGTNWARDPRCDNISKQFEKSFASVPPFWIPVSLPTGSSFVTVFPPAS
jgi:hypothetical protein